MVGALQGASRSGQRWMMKERRKRKEWGYSFHFALHVVRNALLNIIVLNRKKKKPADECAKEKWNANAVKDLGSALHEQVLLPLCVLPERKMKAWRASQSKELICPFCRSSRNNSLEGSWKVHSPALLHFVLQDAVLRGQTYYCRAELLPNLAERLASAWPFRQDL